MRRAKAQATTTEPQTRTKLRAPTVAPTESQTRTKRGATVAEPEPPMEEEEPLVFREIEEPTKYWGLIYGNTHARKIGTAYMGADGLDDVVLGKCTSTPIDLECFVPLWKRKKALEKTRIFTGSVQSETWGFGENPNVMVRTSKEENEAGDTSVPVVVVDDDGFESPLTPLSASNGEESDGEGGRRE